ncbi:MAG: EAL domain-containing protein, partial [Cyanobacteria bacterium P01_D01_bin.73]
SLKQRTQQGEFAITTRSGSQRIWQFSAAPLEPLADGRRVVMSVAVDVTESRQAKADLVESGERYRSIYDQAAVGLVNASFIDKQFIDFNWRFCQMLGYSREELLTKTVIDITHPEDRKKILPDTKRLVNGEINCFFHEKRYIRKDGSSFWSSTGVSLVRDADGKPQHTLAVVRDISEKKRLELERQQTEVQLRRTEQRFRNMAANVPGAIYRYTLHPDGSDRVLYMSRGCFELWEVGAEEVVDDASILWDMTHPDDLPEMVASVMESARSLTPWQFQWRIITPSGQLKWLEAAGRPERHDNGDVVWDSLILDVSDRKRAEIALEDNETRFRLVTENMSDLVCLHNPDGRYLYVTPSSQALLGYQPGDLLGRNPYEFFHPEDCDRVRNESHRPALQGNPQVMIYRMRCKNGNYVWLETLTKPILDSDDNVKHLQTTSRDVSDRVRAEQQLKHDALHDGLTGLPNRILLLERLGAALRRAKGHDEFQFAVLFLDLDNFKVINDSLGHSVGDALLLEVARRLKHLIRPTDVAARLGGDEFVLLLEGIDGLDDAVAVADRILEDFKSPLLLVGREAFISPSIGVLTQDLEHHQTAEDLLRDADLAMYRSKQNGRSQYTVFNPKMYLKAIQRLQLEQELRRGIECQEFVLYYQPIVDLKSGAIRGFEALIRWQHPERGLIAPGEFIAIAEETQLIVPMGQWILETACEQMAVWLAQFPQQSLRMSVNLSVPQLQPKFLQNLDQALAKTGLPGEQLTLEVTESMLVENLEVVDGLLMQLKTRKVHISIDDFGTGYSSLSYLHRLPADALKIDRSFVSLNGPDSRNRAIAESIVTLSNLLELDAIAEGIETPEQLQWLRSMGCELGQGYYFSAPLSVEQATELLEQKVIANFPPAPTPSESSALGVGTNSVGSAS